MRISLPYGDGHQELEIAGDRVAGVLTPNEVEIPDPDTCIREAMDHPVGAGSLEQFLADARDVLVLVNDATRPTPTAAVLDVIADMLAGANASFMVATGAHRAPTEAEYRQIFSDAHYERFRDRIHAHDAFDDRNMVLLGTSKNGTEMRVNRLGAEAHKILIISSVEPHYFAGYTGGRKSFLPGIAAYSTIEQNHKLALSPKARALHLDDNPVHQDMVDALATVDNEVFTINTVLDKEHRVYACVAGDIHQSFARAIHLADEVFGARVAEKADVVVSVVKAPGDINLYQSQKGIDNAKHAVKDGGIIILVSQCREGAGATSFMDLLSSADSPQDAVRRIDDGYVLGYHKAAKMAEISLYADTWAVTSMDPQVMEDIFIRPFGHVQEAVDVALEERGPKARVLILMDGGMTVPLVDGI